MRSMMNTICSLEDGMSRFMGVEGEYMGYSDGTERPGNGGRRQDTSDVAHPVIEPLETADLLRV